MDTNADFAALASLLDAIPANLREEFVPGKTACRNAIADNRDCSEVEAEFLVDTMISRGILRFTKTPDQPGVWVVVAPE